MEIRKPETNVQWPIGQTLNITQWWGWGFVWLHFMQTTSVEYTEIYC